MANPTLQCEEGFREGCGRWQRLGTFLPSLVRRFLYSELLLGWGRRGAEAVGGKAAGGLSSWARSSDSEAVPEAGRGVMLTFQMKIWGRDGLQPSGVQPMCALVPAVVPHGEQRCLLRPMLSTRCSYSTKMLSERGYRCKG